MWKYEQEKLARKRFGRLPIVDAKQRLRFFVSAKDCQQAKGHERDPGNCAFACAMKRIMGEERGIVFFRRIAYVNIGRHIERYMLSPAAAEAVRVFDRTGKFKPGEYHLLRAPKKTRRRKHPADRAHSPSGGRRPPKGHWLNVRNGTGRTPKELIL